MTINCHIKEFAGKKVVEFKSGRGIKDPRSNAYRVAVSYDDDEGWTEKFDALVEDDNARKLEALVIGPWSEDCGDQSDAVVHALTENKDSLPSLNAIFFGDIVMEESEISWIEHDDISSLFASFPRLAHFCVRGSSGLSLGEMNLKNLRSLTVQCGGLPKRIVEEISSSNLPELEHLELWLGEDNYGGDTTVEDLQPILSGKLFPNLIYLGLKNSEIQDDVAEAIARSPLLERIRVLDVSMGTLTDRGAQALLGSPALKKLEFLDMHHHYVSEVMVKRLMSLGIKLDYSEPQESEENDGEVWRYISVSE